MIKAYFFIAILLLFGSCGPGEDDFKPDGEKFLLGGGATGSRIISNVDGGYFVGGRVLLGGEIPYRLFLRKYKSDDKIDWTKIYDIPVTREPNIVSSTDGGVIFVSSTSSVFGGADSGDFLILKTSSAGDSLWMRQVDRSKDDRLSDVTEMNSNIVTFGTAVINDSLRPYYLAFDNNGSILYEGSLLVGEGQRIGMGIEAFNNESMFVYGQELLQNSDSTYSFISILDMDGNLIDDLVIKESIYQEINSSLSLSNEKEFLLAGRKANQYSEDTRDFNYKGWILRIDHELKKTGEKVIDADNLNEIKLIDDDHYFVVGEKKEFGGSFSRNPGNNIYWAKLTMDNGLMASRTFDNGENDVGNSGIMLSDRQFKIVGTTEEKITEYVLLIGFSE